MPQLLLHSKPVESVFNLLGEKENDITYSVGWALSHSASFLREFLRSSVSFQGRMPMDSVAIRLQTYELDRGKTDIEIESAKHFYLILEAKRGWNLPSRRQLGKYLKRKSFLTSRARLKAIVVLSECNAQYAKNNLDTPKNSQLPIIHSSWNDVFVCCKNARQRSTHAEKRLLRELSNYLQSIMTMKKIESNLVFVVALGGSKHALKGSSITSRDIVNKKRRYFHPFGRNGWPSDPPNYIGFRYRGRLQSIHHIESYEVFSDPHSIIKEIPSQKWDDHIVYKLGPAIKPTREVRTGNIFRNGRVWCMLDTLFTSETISDARDLTKRRLHKR